MNQSINKQHDGYAEEILLQEFDPSQQQEMEIAKANSMAAFTPEFIPFYPAVQKEYQLSVYETLIYGFIRFFTTNASERFYFTNSQLAELVGCGVTTASTAITTLEKHNLITTKYRIKFGGGKVRYISPNPTSKISKSDFQKLKGIDNNKEKEIYKEKETTNNTQNNKLVVPNTGGSSSNPTEVSQTYAWVITKINELCGTKYATKTASYGNFSFWLESYSPTEMVYAYHNGLLEDFWKNSLNPTIFFRRFNPQKEPVDRIGQFLNSKHPEALR